MTTSSVPSDCPHNDHCANTSKFNRSGAPLDTANSASGEARDDVSPTQHPIGMHLVPRTSKKGTVWYVYAWRGGPRVLRIEGEDRPILTAAQIATICSIIARRKENIVNPREQTLAWLIAKWRASPEWKAFSGTTQKTWSSALKAIERKWGHRPVMEFYDELMIPQIIAWRDSREDTPRAADTGIAVLRALLKFGRFRVGSTMNIAAGIPSIYAGGNRAEIIWFDEEIEQFVEAARQMGMPALADVIRLAAVTGLRRSDLVTVSDIHLKPAAIFKKALKTNRRKRRHVTIPRIYALAALLDELQTRPRREDVDTVLVDDAGRSWHPDRLTRDFAIVRNALGIEHVDEETGEVRKKHLHDLRGTFVTKLITETGLDDKDIARIMGWSPDEVETIRLVYVSQDAYASSLSNRIPSTAFAAVPLG